MYLHAHTYTSAQNSEDADAVQTAAHIIHEYIFIYAYIYIFAYMYIHIYIYIPTDTHIPPPKTVRVLMPDRCTPNTYI